MLPLLFVILPFTCASLGQVVSFCGFTPRFCAAAKTAVKNDQIQNTYPYKMVIAASRKNLKNSLLHYYSYLRRTGSELIRKLTPTVQPNATIHPANISLG